MRRPIFRAALALAVGCLPLLAAAEEAIDWRRAAECAGRVCSLRGTVAMVEEDGPTYRLYFDASDRSVRVILMRGWLVDWPNYLGQEIVATGTVGRFRDHLEMILLDPRAIEMVGGTPTATASSAVETATQTAAPASATASVTASATETAVAPTPTLPPPTAMPTVAPTAIPTSPPTAIPTVAPAAPPPAAPADEVEQLRQRVRELEERLRRLEEK